MSDDAQQPVAPGFEQWWIAFRGYDDPTGKEGARMAFEAGAAWATNRCRHPQCLDNDDERCPRWLTGECSGPQAT